MGRGPAGGPRGRHAEDAAAALYELALDFQERSQRTEAGLLGRFENAASACWASSARSSIVDDVDEHLELAAGGFRGKVIPEGETDWTDISAPEEIVRFYDPTDVFGDLAEAIADAYPAVAGAAEDGEDVEDAADESTS